jgi:hypothetical protein
VVYLIACDHVKEQTYPEGIALDDPRNTTQREFRDLLIKAIEKHAPSLIAEEHNEDGLKRKNLRSVAREVASEMGIQHRLCEQSIEAKIARGLNGVPNVPPWDRHKAMYKYFLSEWPIREDFWIEQMSYNLYLRVLFICGMGHRETLRRRLERYGIPVRIVYKGQKTARRVDQSDFPAYKAAYRDLRKASRRVSTL